MTPFGPINADVRQLKISLAWTRNASSKTLLIAITKQHEVSKKLRKKVELPSLTSNASSDWGGFDYVARALQMTNSCLPQPPKTSANWPRPFLHRRNPEQNDRKSVRAPFRNYILHPQHAVFQRNGRFPDIGCGSTGFARSVKAAVRCAVYPHRNAAPDANVRNVQLSDVAEFRERPKSVDHNDDGYSGAAYAVMEPNAQVWLCKLEFWTRVRIVCCLAVRNCV